MTAAPRHDQWRSLERGGDGRWAAGAGTLRGQRGRHPGRALGACCGPGRNRGGRAGGPARCLRPGCCAAHLRHFLAAAPQTLACAPGEREGGGRRAEGRGRARRSEPRLARPLPSRQSRRAPDPLPWPAHPGWQRSQARPPPDTGRPAPDPQGRGFYLGPTTGAWETKPQIEATDVCSPLRRSQRLSPGKGWPGGEWQILFFNPAYGT